MRRKDTQSRATASERILLRGGLIGLALIGATILPSFAQQIGSETPKSIHYVLNKEHSKILFAISHFFVSSTQGQFGVAGGQLVLEPQAPERSAVTIRVSPATVSTGNKLRDDHLRAADFFDVEQYPVATFASTGLVKITETTGKMTGTLSLHGTTRPITLAVSLRTPELNADSIKFAASGTLKRSDFGMKNFQGVIGDDVVLDIDVEFDREH